MLETRENLDSLAVGMEFTEKRGGLIYTIRNKSPKEIAGSLQIALEILSPPQAVLALGADVSPWADWFEWFSVTTHEKADIPVPKYRHVVSYVEYSTESLINCVGINYEINQNEYGYMAICMIKHFESMAFATHLAGVIRQLLR